MISPFSSQVLSPDRRIRYSLVDRTVCGSAVARRRQAGVHGPASFLRAHPSAGAGEDSPAVMSRPSPSQDAEDGQTEVRAGMGTAALSRALGRFQPVWTESAVPSAAVTSSHPWARAGRGLTCALADV